MTPETSISTGSTRCAFIAVWFGPFPVWIDFFLESCRHNASTFDWIIFTDQPVPEKLPSNVRFFPMSLASINNRIRDRLGYDVTIRIPYKMCDVKLFYGLLFADFLQTYSHWGHCDIDIVWGDLDMFLTPDIQRGFDIVTVDSTRTSGFCTVYKNEERINRLCTKIPNVEAALREDGYAYVDEWRLPELLSKHPEIRVSYVRRYVEEPNLHTIIWDNGHLFGDDREYALLHMHTWHDTKKKMIVDSVDPTQDRRWIMNKDGFFPANDVPFPLPPMKRESEGILIAAGKADRENLIRLIASIRACETRPILLIDCGLDDDAITIVARYPNILRIPLHLYTDNLYQPSFIERSPFFYTLWIAPHCVVLQPLDEAFTIMREHILIGQHHGALLRDSVDIVRSPTVPACFAKENIRYKSLFHLSTDVMGWRPRIDLEMLEEWKRCLESYDADPFCQAHDTEKNGALLWAMHRTYDILWTISPSQVWNASPLTNEIDDPTFAANKRRGDRIVNRSWTEKSLIIKQSNPIYAFSGALRRFITGKKTTI